MKKEDCVFCKIASLEIPANIIHQDEESISFLDINPVSEGHLLIIPKNHHPYLVETPDEIVKSLFIKAKQLMTPLKEAVGADFVVVSVIGTDVPHFHIHLIPRKKGDGLSGSWPTKKYESDTRMKEVAEKIKKAI